MDVRARDQAARWQRHPLHGVLLAVALAVSSCSLMPGSPPAGFEQRTADAYGVLVPVDWETVEDSDRAFQAADPTVDEPMTVRVAVTPNPVPDVETTAAQLRALIPQLGEDGRLVDERRREVPGATGAVQLTSQAALSVATTGDSVRVRLVDLLARAQDGRVVVVKVQGPVDEFDQQLAETILSSLSLVTPDA